MANPQSAELTLIAEVGLRQATKKVDDTKQAPTLEKAKALEMFDDFKVRQAQLLQSADVESDYDSKVVDYAKMQDEFFFKWNLEIEDLHDAMQYYIN